jgi:hypothetical protein
MQKASVEKSFSMRWSLVCLPMAFGESEKRDSTGFPTNTVVDKIKE